MKSYNTATESAMLLKRLDAAFHRQVGNSDCYKLMKLQPIEFCLVNELNAVQSLVIEYVARMKNDGSELSFNRMKKELEGDMKFVSDETKIKGDFEKRRRESVVNALKWKINDYEKSIHCLELWLAVSSKYALSKHKGNIDYVEVRKREKKPFIKVNAFISKNKLGVFQSEVVHLIVDFPSEHNFRLAIKRLKDEIGRLSGAGKD